MYMVIYAFGSFLNPYIGDLLPKSIDECRFLMLLATERKNIFPPQQLKHAAQWLGGRVGAIILEQPLEPVYKLGARSQTYGATLIIAVCSSHSINC